MLWQRVLTAVILGPLVLLVILWAPPLMGVALIGCALLAGAWEWSAFAKLSGFAPRIAYVAITAALMWLAWQATDGGEHFNTLLLIALCWWVVAFVWLALRPAQASLPSVAIAGFLVIVPTWIALAHLQQAGNRGPQWVLFMLFLIWSADVGAYFAGRKFGSIKLAPRVSPGKTWEGVIGGLLASGVAMAVGIFWFAPPVWPFVGLCCAVVLVSIVGDLTESSFKRYAGLKDSGQLLPGHGGMLDRIDSVTAAAPVFALGLKWLGVAP